VAAHRLGMRLAVGLFGAAGLAALAELQLPYHYEALDPVSGRVVPDPAPGTAYDEQVAFHPLEGPRLALVLLALVLGGIALTLVLRELRRRAATTTDTASTEQLGLLEWVVPVAFVAIPVVLSLVRVVQDGELDPVWNGAWEVPAIVGIVVALAVAFLFASRSNRRWSASGEEVGSPWADLMLRDADRPTG
jgi:hypothetical protein